jgi:hypothetical protein
MEKECKKMTPLTREKVPSGVAIVNLNVYLQPQKSITITKWISMQPPSTIAAEVAPCRRLCHLPPFYP